MYATYFGVLGNFHVLNWFTIWFELKRDYFGHDFYMQWQALRITHLSPSTTHQKQYFSAAEGIER